MPRSSSGFNSMLSKLDIRYQDTQVPESQSKRNRNVLVNDLVPVGLDLVFSDILKFFSEYRQCQSKEEKQRVGVKKLDSLYEEKSCSRHV